MGLTPPLEQKDEVWLDVAKTQDAAQLLGKTLYHQGDLSYFEAVNKETLKNAFLLFEDEGIVNLHKSKDKKIPTTIKLAEGWTPERDDMGNVVPEGSLWSFIETIANSRREGKNRRDGATVSTRVLALADKVGRQLFESAAAPVNAAAGSAVRSSSKRRSKEMQAKARL